MYDYAIAIPSYKRSDSLIKKTLRVLIEEEIPLELIYIFVVAEEYYIYKSVLPEELHERLIIGVHSLRGQRNFIQHYFPVGKRIVMIDDDITRIKRLNGAFFNPDGGLAELFNNLFAYSDLKGCKLWGVYPASNYFFMRKSAHKGLLYCIGSLFGMVNCQDILSPVCCKEDFYTTIYCYNRDSGIMRFNGISPVSTYWKGTGGLNAYRTIENERLACLEIQSLFPADISNIVHKTNGRWDIVLAKHPKQVFLLEAYAQPTETPP